MATQQALSPRRIRRHTPVQPRAGRVVVRSRVIESSVVRSDTSRQIDIDNLEAAAGSTIPLRPPYNIGGLLNAYEQSNMLKQCVAAYVTNIAAYGWDVVPVSKDIEADPDEEEILRSFADSPNADESLTTLHGKVVEDKEKLGYSFVEVIRDKVGRVSILRHARASVTLLCPKNPKSIAVTYDIARGKKVSNVTEKKTFRIYAQMVGGKITYFKEFGDPRRLDCVTGRFEDENPDRTKVPEDRLATELIHIRQNSEDLYGTPRWISQLPSVMGSREVEEVNLRYFEDNTVPPMMLTVAGGRLTGESYRDLKKLLASRKLGKERQNQILLIEAVPERESLDDKGNVSLKVDKLADVRPSDGLFKTYDESNQAKIRSSFRLPPVAVGLSQDVTFATANVSAFIAETQVYAPERAGYDEVYNKKLVNNPLGLGLKTVCLRSRAPSITNPEMLVKTLTALNVMGAITPRSAIDAVNSILRTELPNYPEKGEAGYQEWMDQPIQVSLKQSGGVGIDPAGAGNTHDTQSVKTPDVKGTEGTGDVSLASPENGTQ